MNLNTALRQQIQAVRDRPVTSNILQLLFGSGIAQVFTALATLLVTRSLGAADYGEYAACYAIASLTSTAFNFGMDNWLLQQGRAHGSDLDQFLGNSLVVRALLGIPWLMGLTLVAPLLNANTYPPSLVLLMGVSVWIDGLIAACHAYFKSKLLNTVTALLLILNTAGLFGLFLFLSWQGASVEAFTIARATITFTVLAITLLVLARKGHLRWNRAWVRTMLHASVPFAFSELFYLIYMRSDVAIIGIRLGTEAVGWYSPASFLISALFLIPSSLYMVMVPVLSRQIHDIRHAAPEEKPPLQHRFGQQLRKLMLGTLLLGVVLTVGTAIVGPPLLARLLTANYAPAGNILRILSLLLLFKAASFSLAALLVAADLQVPRVRLQAVIALLSAGATFVLAEPYGITAVAWLYVTTEALLSLGYALMSVWWLKTRRLLV